MFHAFDVVIDHALVEPEKLEEIGQQLVPACDVAGEDFARGGEDESAIFFILEQAIGVEPLHHVRHAGLGDLQAGRDIDDARVALGVNQFEDALKVVLDCGGVAQGNSFGGHGRHLK